MNKNNKNNKTDHNKPKINKYNIVQPRNKIVYQFQKNHQV